MIMGLTPESLLIKQTERKKAIIVFHGRICPSAIGQTMPVVGAFRYTCGATCRESRKSPVHQHMFRTYRAGT